MLQLGSQLFGLLLGHHHRVACELAAVVEIPARCHPLAVDPAQPARKLPVVPAIRACRRALRRRARRRGGRELGRQVPILGRHKHHAFAFPIHNHPGRHRLHPARAQPGHHLLPQHRGNLIAIQPVQNTAGFLRIHQVIVQLPGVLGRRYNRRLGDLMEHHASHRHLRL